MSTYLDSPNLNESFKQLTEDTDKGRKLGDDIKPKKAREYFSYASKIDGGELDFETSEYISDISRIMAKADAKGFIAHDEGDFVKAELYFFFKDINMWDSKIEEEGITAEDVSDASKAYSDALRAKDCLEWVALPEKYKKEAAGISSDNSLPEELENTWDYYKDLSTSEVHEELNDEEKEILGVRDTSLELFINDESENLKERIDAYWESLHEEEERNIDRELLENADIESINQYWENIENDEIGRRLIKEYSKKRAEALNFEPDSRELYTEEWWIPHKTAAEYDKFCKITRNAELYEATKVEEFLDMAKALNENKEDKLNKVSMNPKPLGSEGQGDGGIISTFYPMSVDAHDLKGIHGLQMMNDLASKYYRPTLLSQVKNSFELNRKSVASFALVDLQPKREIRKTRFRDWKVEAKSS